MADQKTSESKDGGDEVSYTRPATALDAERRLAEGNTVSSRMQGVNPSEAIRSDEGYVGVNPEYQNAANETDEPRDAEEGVEKDLEDAYYEAVEQGPQDTDEGVKSLYYDAANPKDGGEQKVQTAKATVTPPETSEGSDKETVTEGHSVSGGAPTTKSGQGNPSGKRGTSS